MDDGPGSCGSRDIDAHLSQLAEDHRSSAALRAFLRQADRNTSILKSHAWTMLSAQPRSCGSWEAAVTYYPPGGRYVVFLDVAESTSAGVRRTVVLTLAPPPALTAIAAAATDTLSG